MDGWNGRVCRDPASNTYCVGSASHPGEMIAEKRDVEWEKANAGKSRKRRGQAVSSELPD